jgi:isopenicillin N synthase-like dioxygenase
MPPIIDFSLPGETTADRDARLARALGHACREVGFFYLRSHGLEDMVAPLFAASRAFFALPLAAKSALALTSTTGNRGYVGLRAEALDPGAPDNKEAFNITAASHEGFWPDMPGFAGLMADYFARANDLGRAVHAALAIDLGLDRAFFESRLDRPMSTLRLLHYPPAMPGAALGAGEHTDYGNLTLLLTDDAGGLAVRQRDGAWIDAPPMPGAFVCNIGDCLMRWTNDVYLSTPHRVTSPAGRERYSIAFFLDPNADAMVEAIPSCVGPDRPARHAPIRADDYLASRFAATYGFGAA